MAEAQDDKHRTLKRQGALHPQPDRVSDELFQDPFFDPRDLVQVKYEMLRRVHQEQASVSKTTAQFGFSRPTFYQVQTNFDKEGLPGLVPKKRGPRGAHKLTAEVVVFLRDSRNEEQGLSAQVLAQRVQERFGVTVHPRSIERVLGRRKKKR